VPNATITTQSILKAALQYAHRQVLEGTMADVDDDLANRPSGSLANPIGAAYAHLVLSEDAILNGILKGGTPLSAGSWAGRTGVDKPMSFEGDMKEWYHSVKVDLSTLRQYAQVVFASSEEFIGSASDEELAREMEIFTMKMPLAVAFEIFVTGHCNSLAGEISAMKGTFGRKGYPF
jgi:hypothetical protein